MQLRTYRLTVVGSLLSSFLVGFHLPALHEMIEHGASPRWDVLGVTIALAVLTIVLAWTLLRSAAPAR
jgi:hypothetical protein